MHRIPRMNYLQTRYQVSNSGLTVLPLNVNSIPGIEFGQKGPSFKREFDTWYGILVERKDL